MERLIELETNYKEIQKQLGETETKDETIHKSLRLITEQLAENIIKKHELETEIENLKKINHFIVKRDEYMVGSEYDTIKYIFESNPNLVLEEIIRFEDYHSILSEEDKRFILEGFALSDFQEFYVKTEDFYYNITKENYIDETLENKDFWNFVREYMTDLSIFKDFMEIGRVGRDSTYYVALKDTSESFIIDLYEGWNFYTIERYDGTCELVDSVSGIYISYSTIFREEVKDVIIGNFDVTQFTFTIKED